MIALYIILYFVIGYAAALLSIYLVDDYIYKRNDKVLLITFMWPVLIPLALLLTLVALIIVSIEKVTDTILGPEK